MFVTFINQVAFEKKIKNFMNFLLQNNLYIFNLTNSVNFLYFLNKKLTIYEELCIKFSSISIIIFNQHYL